MEQYCKCGIVTSISIDDLPLKIFVIVIKVLISLFIIKVLISLFSKVVSIVLTYPRVGTLPKSQWRTDLLQPAESLDSLSIPVLQKNHILIPVVFKCQKPLRMYSHSRKMTSVSGSLILPKQGTIEDSGRECQEYRG